MRRAYWKGDYDKMNQILSETDWNVLLHNTNVEESWQLIKQKCLQAEDAAVPTVIKSNKKKLHFLSKATKKLIHKRDKAYKSYRLLKRQIDYDKYKKIRNEVNRAIRREKEQDLKLSLIHI